MMASNEIAAGSLGRVESYGSDVARRNHHRWINLDLLQPVLSANQRTRLWSATRAGSDAGYDPPHQTQRPWDIADGERGLEVGPSRLVAAMDGCATLAARLFGFRRLPHLTTSGDGHGNHRRREPRGASRPA